MKLLVLLNVDRIEGRWPGRHLERLVPHARLPLDLSTL